MRSTIRRKLTAALLATSLGVGWVSAGNLDQLNYVQVTGGRVQDLFSPPQSSIFPNNPFPQGPFTELINPFITVIPETPIQSTGDGTQNSATWIRGWIEPPQTGEYTFWVAGSDDAEFYFNTTPGDINGKALEAFTDGGTGADAWATRLSQKSRVITLTKGQQYYFELLQKGNGVGGLSQLGWWLPDFTLQRPIPIRYAQRFAFAAECNPATGGCSGSWVSEASVPDPIFDRGPGGATANDRTLFITEGSSVDLSPWLTAQYPVAFQWFLNDAAETDEITSTKFIERVAASDSGNVYHVQADDTISKKVTLTVLPDSTPPTVDFASTSGSVTGFSIIYSENVDPSTATNIANYSVTGGLTITDIEMLFGDPDGNIVVVTTDASVDSQITVTINNVADTSDAMNVIAADTEATVGITDGILTLNLYGAVNGGDAIGGTVIDDLIDATQRFSVLPGGTDPENGGLDAPDASVNVTFAGLDYNGSTRNFADNYGARLVGFLIPPETGNYNFVIAADDQAIVYISNDTDPANKFALAVEKNWNGWRNFTSEGRRTINNSGRDGFVTDHFPGMNPALPAHQSKNTLGNVALVAGNKYYFEALMKEGGGGDNIDVTWQLPGTWNFADNTGLSNGQDPIPGRFFSLFNASGQAGRIAIIEQPADTTTDENQAITLGVIHGGSPSFAYQWFRDGIIIPDANSREFPLLVPGNTDNGAVYTVRVRNLFSEEVSASATLTVNPDLTAPTVVRAIGSPNFNTVTIQFDEVIDPATATDPGNYDIATTEGGDQLQVLGNGSLLDPVIAGFTSVRFATAPQAQGVNYTITINGVKDIAEAQNVIATDSTVAFTGWVVSRGFVLYERYLGINGGAIHDLYEDPDYPDNPDIVQLLNIWEAPANVGDNYGARITGFFFPQQTGRHDFYFATDDNGALWLSTDDNPANLEQVAFEPAWGSRKSYTGTSGGRRADGDNNTAGDNLASLNMTAGEARFMLNEFNEGGGGDYMDATYKGPAADAPNDTTPANGSDSRMLGAYIGTFANPDETVFTFDPQPVGGTFGEGTAVTLTADGSGSTLDAESAPIFWQWQVKAAGDTDFSDIQGANSASYTTARVLPADDSSEYRVIANIPGLATISDVATLSVNPDSTPPTVAAVTGSSSGTAAVVYYDEIVDPASAAAVANYVIVDSADAVLGISAASLSSDGRVVTLTTAAQIPGEQYGIVIQNVADTAFVPNVMDPFQGTFTAWQASQGFVRQRLYFNIGGGSISDLTGNAKFPDSPDSDTFLSAVDTPPSSPNRENYGTYMNGWLSVDTTGDYLFAISGDDQQVFMLSTDADPANKVAVVSEPSWNGHRNWNTNDRRVGNGNDAWFSDVTTLPVNRSQNTVGAITLTQGETYYFEALGKEGGGGDSTAVTWWLDGDPMPANNDPAIPASNVSSFINPDNSINVTAQPADTTAPLGGSATISVTANPTAPALGGPITYQWYKDGAMVPGANGSSIGTADAQAAEYGDYWVVMNAPGAAEVTSATATFSQEPGGGDVTLTIVDNGDGTVTVSYPTSDQAGGNQLQSQVAITTPNTFADDTSGADNAGSFDTSKDTSTDGETYWRTEKPPAP